MLGNYKDIECIFVRLRTRKVNLLLGCVHKPPNISSNNFISESESILVDILPQSDMFSVCWRF